MGSAMGRDEETAYGVGTVRRSVLSVCTGILAAGLLAITTFGAAPVAAASGAHASAGARLSGLWVATGTFGKIVLRLRKTGTLYRGTYTQVSGATHVSNVVARVVNADGAQLVTLSLTPGGRSEQCGLRGARLYCQVGATGTAVFTHS
jgi:glutamate dehydrogenase/leucine dehydrogenase